MANTLPPLDQVIQESIHLAGGVELLGDPQTALSGKAGPVCELFDLSDEGLALLNPEATVAEQISVWREANLVADARRLLSHALPPRYSLWWALLTLTEAHRQKPYPAKVIEAVLGVRDFVLDPTEVGRRRCQVLADAADSTTAGGVIGYAAFLSGGSMAPPECPPVLPKGYLCGRLAGVAVYLASVHFNPAKYKEHLQHFLDIGLQVANGELSWPKSQAVAEKEQAEQPLEALVEQVVETIQVGRSR
jgi:hypothetical protein